MRRRTERRRVDVCEFLPELLLKAARMAKPGIDWVTTNGVVQKNPLSAGILVPQYFDPHDPTKGDLGALNQKLEEAGWIFSYSVDYDIDPSEDGQLGRVVGERWLYFAA